MLFQGDAPEGSDTFQWPVIERDRMGGLRLIIWDKVKVPLCHYRVMHRKRVTSELHDSYFRLMTIKHSISKIEWASNDYITQLSSTSSRVAVGERRDVVGKATPDRGGPREPQWSLGTWEVADKNVADHPAEWALGLRLSSPWEWERHNADGHNSGVKILQLCSNSNSLSHANLEYPFSNPCNKVRGKYFAKEVFLRLYHCVCRLFLRLFIYCIVMMLHEHVY